MKPSLPTHHNPINVLIVDNKQIIRDGLKVMLLSKDTSFSIRVSEAEDSVDIDRWLQNKQFNIILLDPTLPDATPSATAERIFTAQPDARILWMSNELPPLEVVSKLMNLGGSGLLIKNIQRTDLHHAIRDVFNGRIYYSTPVANLILQSTRQKKAVGLGNPFNITETELTVLKLLSQGKTSKEIANELLRGVRTVEGHRKNLMIKLGAKKVTGLVRTGIELNLI